MSTDDKIRFGMVALTGASVVLATMGVHLSPLTNAQGWGGA
jgi:hypothetical protein